MSDDPEKRLKQLQTGNPIELRLLLSIKCNSRAHAYKLEGTLHELLKGKRILNEWFRVMRSKVFKTINVLANNPDYKQVVNNVGLFMGPDEDEKIEQKARGRLSSLVDFGKKEQLLINKNKRKDIEIEDMIAKLNKRKREAHLFRLKLNEFGLDHRMIDEMLGRK
jgi:hypothetical protein